MKTTSLVHMDARYWTAMLVASMCGTNFGDVFPDVLKLSTLLTIAILAAFFSVVVLIDKILDRGHEIRYWAIVLIIRAGATDVADFLTGPLQLGYILAASVLALFLWALIEVKLHSSPHRASSPFPDLSNLYWLTMLVAGALGTVVGDGVGHSFGAVTIGVPVSTGLATCTLVMLYVFRSPLMDRGIVGYWVAIVAVRWWGTNAGDISAFVSSLLISLCATAAALAFLLKLWPSSRKLADGSHRYRNL